MASATTRATCCRLPLPLLAFSLGWAELPQLGQRGSAVNAEMSHLPWREGNRSGESLFVEAPLCHTNDSSFYASDGLHLTAEGYAEFGTRLAKNEALIEFILS